MGSDDDCRSLFACTLCGDCCKGFGGTYVSESDIEAIADFVGISRERLKSSCTCRSGSRRVLAQADNGYCIFWDKVCTIHAVKPGMCRNWPFIQSILVDVANWRAMASSCPGMDADAPDGRIIACVKKALKP